MTYPEPEAYNAPSEHAHRRRVFLFLCVVTLAAVAWFSWRAWPSTTGPELLWKTTLSAVVGFGLMVVMHRFTSNGGRFGLMKYSAFLHLLMVVLGWLAILTFYPSAFAAVHLCTLIDLVIAETVFLYVTGW